MKTDEARRRFAAARVARLASADVSGRPHVVPIVFAVDQDRIYSAIDSKPKRGSQLRRLTNIAANPRVALLVDHYSEAWGALWWVRADGRAELVEDGSPRERAIRLLAAKYTAYRDGTVSIGPVLVVTVERWTGWEAEAD
jgi:PPOX class probable F420-dependent enzyme